jgi:hypothetical protein
MQKLTKYSVPWCASRKVTPSRERRDSGLSTLQFAGTIIATTVMTLILSACGGSTSGSSQQSATLSGNWQFTMAPQTDGNNNDPTFNGGLEGGFLLQNNNSATGQTVYSITPSTTQTPCNSGSAPVTVTISGQNVAITEVAGTQTFTLTGTLSSNGSTMMGTYTSTAGTAANGSVCGYVETALPWSAVSVPPLTGSIQGSFHSTETGTDLTNQDFAVTGSLTQGQNIGASNATITGTLSFIDPTTLLSDYPCFSQASVNGQISGDSVILQIIGINGSTLGQIGAPPLSGTGVNPVTLESSQNGYILHGAGPSYILASSSCPGNLGAVSTAGDSGDICLALNGTAACQQPITLSPAFLTFPSQMLGSAPTTQTVTLTNNSNSPLSGLTLNFSNNYDNLFGGFSDFNGLPSFAETDACGAAGVPSNGEPFNLASAQSCTITVSFAPQESCPWVPFGNPPAIAGAAPQWCPLPQSAIVTATLCTTNCNNGPISADGDQSFAVPITGVGASALQPSAPELDFGAEQQGQLQPPLLGEASIPQMLSFTNNGAYPVQILGRAPCVNQSATSHTSLPSPRLATSPVAGLQVVSNDVYQILQDPGTTPATIFYRCDSDPGTFLPNFQISADSCTGTVLAPQTSCSLQVSFVPQPNTDVNSGLDYFLELNTVQCYGAVTSDCEIDSGRFPVELRANTPSPLRMSPSAGLDFGNQTKGKNSVPLTITLLNDPTLTTTQTVNFIGKIQVQGNYSETDDCPVTLAPGSSCTLTVTFNPSSVGFNPGTLTINYSPEPFNEPQAVYLRGTGQ